MRQDEASTTGETDPGETERFEFSGIEERRGIVPKWLVVVSAVLLVWMVWYLVQFWTDRG